VWRDSERCTEVGRASVRWGRTARGGDGLGVVRTDSEGWGGTGRGGEGQGAVGRERERWGGRGSSGKG